MLVSLRIENLAVIDRVEIPFRAGLNVLTGETGVGKSIVVTALGLLLGGKASAVLLRTGEREGGVEAVFRFHGKERVLRRIITSSGKARAYLDGQPITLSELASLMASCLEIYGQDQHYLLRDPRTHLEVLDSWAGLEGERRAYQRAYSRYLEVLKELEGLRARVLEAHRRREFLLMQIEELEKAGLREGEEGELKKRRQELLDRQRRLEALTAVSEGLSSALKAVAEASRLLERLGDQDPFPRWRGALQDLKGGLEDLSFEVERSIGQLGHDPLELERIETRLFRLERLKAKYGAKDTEELLKVYVTLKRELQELEGIEDRLRELEREVKEREEEAVLRARVLSEGRRGAAERLSKAMEEALAELGMPQVTFLFAFRDPQGDIVQRGDLKLGPMGAEDGEFLFSSNPGEEPRPLWAIASGGELSRTMLALKGLSRQERPMVMVFDEIDAGIGGITAEVVGRKLRELSRRHQLLCVTHLPQIAAQADHHLRVRKEVLGGRTRVVVEPIEGEERKWEIARMLAGGSVTAITLRQAEELLQASSERQG